MDAIGFDLYMDMLERIHRRNSAVRKFPKVDDTQVDLNITAFVPNDYIPDLEQKMSAYRGLASASSKVELMQITADLSDRLRSHPPRYGATGADAAAKAGGQAGGPFSRIQARRASSMWCWRRPWKNRPWKFAERRSCPAICSPVFVYSSGKVTVRGLGVLKPEKQLESLTEWLGYLQGAIPEPVLN